MTSPKNWWLKWTARLSWSWCEGTLGALWSDYFNESYPEDTPKAATPFHSSLVAWLGSWVLMDKNLFGAIPLFLTISSHILYPYLPPCFTHPHTPITIMIIEFIWRLYIRYIKVLLPIIGPPILPHQEITTISLHLELFRPAKRILHLQLACNAPHSVKVPDSL